VNKIFATEVEDSQLTELLRNVRSATPEELIAQGQSLGRSYKPGPRQARHFPPEPLYDVVNGTTDGEPGSFERSEPAFRTGGKSKPLGMGGHTLPNEGDSKIWLTPKHILDRLGHFDLDRDLVFASAWHNPSLPAEPVEVPRG
jgi:hypothetical protein